MVENLNNDKLLNIGTLNLGTEYEKLAYLVDVRENIGNFGEFLIFSFKDCNSNRVTGTLGNQDDFYKSGMTALKMKNKPVKIRFLTREYNGGVSLRLSEISVLDITKEDFPLIKFIGSYGNAKNDVKLVEVGLGEFLGKQYTIVNSQRYCTATIPKIYNGLVGGYCALLNFVFFDLYNMKGINSIDSLKLMKVFASVQEEYFRYLCFESKATVLKDVDKAAFITNIAQKYSKDLQLYSPVFSCMMGLSGLSQPTNIYAYLIYDAFKHHERILNITTSYSTMLVGGSRKVGDITLIKEN